MKNVFAIAMVLVCSLLFATSANAQVQKGNPLRNIRVTDMTGVVANATISIDDFDVVNGEIWVTSTLSGYVSGFPISETVSYPISILASDCNMLILSPGVAISGDNFYIANFAVTIDKGHGDNRLKNALCSIAELNGNASPNALVAKIKQAVKALL